MLTSNAGLGVLSQFPAPVTPDDAFHDHDENTGVSAERREMKTCTSIAQANNFNGVFILTSLRENALWMCSNAAEANGSGTLLLHRGIFVALS
jgi:hypothetical protein